MTTTALQKKLSSLLPDGETSFEEFAKQALLLQLQEVNRKIAVFEGRYNQEFREFEKSWKQMKKKQRFSYIVESDYFDWQALDEYKRNANLYTRKFLRQLLRRCLNISLIVRSNEFLLGKLW